MRDKSPKIVLLPLVIFPALLPAIMLPLLLSRHLSDRALGLAMGIPIGLSLVALGCYARTLAGERKR